MIFYQIKPFKFGGCNVPRCRASGGVELETSDACKISFNPLGKAGTIGMNLLAVKEGS